MKRLFTGAILSIALIASTPFMASAQAAPAKADTAESSKAVATVNAKEGLFYLYSEISDDSVKDLTQKLEDFTADTKNDGKPVRIIMNSPGGNIINAFALMDEISRVRSEGHRVTIEDYGMAASAAGWVLQAADVRAIGANSWVLIHEASSEQQGKVNDLQAQLRFTSQLQDQFVQILARRSKLTAAEIHAHIDNGQDWWIPAQDALKYGLVDKIEPVPAFH